MCEIMIDSNLPESQTGSCVGPTVPRLCGDIVDCPAPEVWTDGFGGVHRKVFGESAVLMFTASWLNHWGACWQDQRKWGHSKSKMCVCFSVCWWCEGWNGLLLCFLFFLFCLPCFSCWTAGHNYIKKAIMVCLTEHITESASNQQNEFQSKWMEWHSTSHSNKRWYVKSPQSHYSLYTHHPFSDSGALRQSCHLWERKYGRNKHDFHQTVHRSVGSGKNIKYLVIHGSQCGFSQYSDQACDSPCGDGTICNTVYLVSKLFSQLQQETNKNDVNYLRSNEV